MALRWLSVLVLGAALLGACGDDTTKAAKDAGTDSGPTAGKGGGGGGGTGGTAPEAIMCGTTKCDPPEIAVPDGGLMFGGMTVSPALIAMFGVGPENCCAGAKQDICGVTQSMLIMDGTCLERTQAGRTSKETECPGSTTSIMGFDLPLTGCCRPDNKCGIDLGILGVGCLERTEAGRIGMMGASMTDAALPDLSAKSCVYAPATGDGGSDDAGH
jgi:hypothetical protein